MLERKPTPAGEVTRRRYVNERAGVKRMMVTSALQFRRLFCLRLCPDGAVERLRDKIGSVRHGLRNPRVPLLRFLGRKRAENCTMGKLRLRRFGLLEGGKLREDLYTGQPCPLKTPIQTGIGASIASNEATWSLYFGFELGAKWDIDDPRNIQGTHHYSDTATGSRDSD